MLTEVSAVPRTSSRRVQSLPGAGRAIFLNHRAIYALVSLASAPRCRRKSQNEEDRPATPRSSRRRAARRRRTGRRRRLAAAGGGARRRQPPPRPAPTPQVASTAGSNGQPAGDSGDDRARARRSRQAAGRRPTTCRRPTPQQEMGLSNSTLHWLEDGEQAVPGRLTEPGTMPSYDPRAPGRGSPRARVVVVGGAGVVGADRRGHASTARPQNRHAAAAAGAAAVGARPRFDDPRRGGPGREHGATRRWTWPTWRSSAIRASRTPTSSSPAVNRRATARRTPGTHTASTSSWRRSAPTRRPRAPRWRTLPP